MISSGPRTDPSNWLNAIEAAPTRASDRWASPGPRYNVRQRLTSSIPGKHIGTGPKFSQASRLPRTRVTESPGPAYMPSYKAVEKHRPSTTMCPRRDVGSTIGTLSNSGPGPAYHPQFDNKGHFRATPAFSFADHDPNTRRSTQRSRQRKRIPSATTKKRTLKPKVEQSDAEIYTEASIHEMRRGIWHKLRGRGGLDAESDADMLFDSLQQS